MNETNNLIIAIDGPAGAGKSTIAKQVADQLGVKYLDTGAMYRAIALVAMQNNVDITNENELKQMLNSFELDVQYNRGKNYIYINGHDITNKLRRPEISKAVSYVASNYWVRNFLLYKQREIGKYGCVLDGRDIGTNVFPDADFKFYLTADLEERAKRRKKDLLEQGYDQDLITVMDELKQRDISDQSRTVNPLRIAEDAVKIDTTSLSIEEVVAKITTYINKKVSNYEKRL